MVNENNLTRKNKMTKENAVAKAAEIMEKAKAAISAAKVKSDEERSVRKAEIEKERAARAMLRAEETAKRVAEKQVKDAARQLERLKKDVARTEKKAAKAAAKASASPKLPSHMKKLDKFAEKLPSVSTLGNDAAVALDKVNVGLSNGNITLADLSTVIAHMSFAHRQESTIRSKSCKIEDADRVKIISCIDDPSLVGSVGTVIQVRKIHALVDVGRKNPAYVYLSDLVCIEHAVAQVTESTTSEEDTSADETDLSVAANG